MRAVISETSRDSMITLRPATMDDRDILMQWRNDIDDRFVVRSIPPSSEVTRSEHELWLAHWITRMARKESSDSSMTEGLFMAEVHMGSPLLVGTGRITLNFHSRVPASCLIHYMIAPESRKKGLGTQLVHALVHKATDEMHYRTVGAQIHRTNMASLKCALMGGVTAVEFL